MRIALVVCLVGCANGGGEESEVVDASVDVALDSRTGDALIFEVEDPSACGSCSLAAPACVGGTCICPGTLCGGECVDNAADPRHCSTCSMACATAQYCRLGAGPACKCRPPAVACAGQCRDRNSDPNACGDCDRACPIACARGACVDTCPVDLRGCPITGKTACVDIKKDPSHCGACGVTCAADEICAAGKCARYRPAVGCATCPCPVCATTLPDSACCPGLAGHPSPICVKGTDCP